MSRVIGFMLVTTSFPAIAASGSAAEPDATADVNTDGILLSESFEDADLARRSWYDGTTFRIAGDAVAGKGCIEYEWPDGQSGVKGSSPVRRLFEATDEVSIRFYLKVSTPRAGVGAAGTTIHT